MKLVVVPGRPVTIGALTAIAEGVVPATNSSPINLIWTFVKPVIG